MAGFLSPGKCETAHREQSFIREYLALAIFSFLTFCPSLQNGFVWDDKGIIFKQIHHIKDLNIYKPGSVYYRPFTQISFLLDYLLWGYHPFGYHLTNVILHVLNVLLFFILARKVLAKLKIDSTVAFLLALVFALHPVHVESVSWVAGRTDILVTFFSLLTLVSTQLYWENKEKKLLLLTLIFFLLALASKEVAVTLVPILLIEGLFIAPRIYHPKRDRLFNICLLLATGILIFYALFKLSALRAHEWQFDPLSLVRATGFYLKSLVLPWPFYSYMPYIPSWGAWVSAGCFLITGLLFFIVLEKNMLCAQVGLAYLIISLLSLLPALALIVFHISVTPVAWRYLYMPSVFFVLGAGMWLTKTKKEKLILLVICSCLFLITITHQSIWHDDLRFWKKAITMSSKDYALPHHQYALALWERGDTKGAERHFILSLKAKDLQSYPRGKSVVYTNLGKLYTSQEKWRIAEACFKKALYYNPKFRPALCSLGRLYFLVYQKTNKEELWEKAKRLLKECR